MYMGMAMREIHPHLTLMEAAETGGEVKENFSCLGTELKRVFPSRLFCCKSAPKTLWKDKSGGKTPTVVALAGRVSPAQNPKMT
eukprot:6490666-Amphidinium_carterae.1